MITILADAFHKLEINIPPKKVEDLAILINKSLALRTRFYHTAEHVFKLTDRKNPLITLAALYHDIVYYQVDHEFSEEVYRIIQNYIIIEDDDDLSISPHAPLHDKYFTMVMELFGFEIGQQLSPFEGLNEFLSALVMSKSLERILTMKQLVRTCTCIEATIPFRDNQTYIEQINTRLERVNQKYGLNMTCEEVSSVIKDAVTLSNNDVLEFSLENVDVFLEGTWKLLPETNSFLRQSELYSIKEYREALEKMEGFYAYLDPESIFKQYEDALPDSQYAELVDTAILNVATGREYLGIKLFTVAVLEAIAYETGGDAPVALFMGHIPKDEEDFERIELHLPDIFVSVSGDETETPDVFNLLKSGRAGKPHFDLTHSPLAFFLYSQLGPERVRALLPAAKSMFMGKLAPADFLAEVNPAVLSPIAEAIQLMAWTRSEQLEKFIL